MVNSVMPYAWGSRDGIARLQGRPASEEPEAELWMGAHPQAPSLLEGPDGVRALDAVVAAAPDDVLGTAVVQRFGPRLPFLLKLLSAAEPLSLQVHPDDELARARFADEEAAGIDRSAANRLYRDPYGKPEMLVAITDFELLLGFRPAHEAAAAIRGFGVRQLDSIAAALDDGMVTGAAFLEIVDWPDDARRPLVADVRAAATRVADDRSAWLTLLADRYPGDPGVAAILLLNFVRLREGQGLYVAPGQIHSYLRGTGVEILGGSDNVVRGGLTPKHIAIEELRNVLSLDSRQPVVIEPTAAASPGNEPDNDERWATPRAEFALSRIPLRGDATAVGSATAQILLCLEGKIEVAACDGTVTLAGGESAFVTADTGSVTLNGHGVVLRATPGTIAMQAQSPLGQSQTKAAS